MPSEDMIGEKDELVFLGLVVRLKGIPEEGDVFLLSRGLEGEWKVVGELGGFFFAPDSGKGSLNLLLEAGD